MHIFAGLTVQFDPPQAAVCRPSRAPPSAVWLPQATAARPARYRSYSGWRRCRDPLRAVSWSALRPPPPLPPPAAGWAVQQHVGATAGSAVPTQTRRFTTLLSTSVKSRRRCVLLDACLDVGKHIYLPPSCHKPRPSNACPHLPPAGSAPAGHAPAALQGRGAALSGGGLRPCPPRHRHSKGDSGGGGNRGGPVPRNARLCTAAGGGGGGG